MVIHKTWNFILEYEMFTDGMFHFFLKSYFCKFFLKKSDFRLNNNFYLKNWTNKKKHIS